MKWYTKYKILTAQNINGYSGIINPTSTGIPGYDLLLRNLGRTQELYGKDAEIQMMSPQDYENAITSGFWSDKENKKKYRTFETFTNWIQEQRPDKFHIEMLAKEKSLPLPVIEYLPDGGIIQEGEF